MRKRHEVDGSSLRGAERDAFAEKLFDQIARRYDRLNRVMSLGRDLAWRRQALRLSGVRPGSVAVDLGTGSGDFYIALRQAVGEPGKVIGLDIAENMLDLARHKAQSRFPGEPHDLRRGAAHDTGLPGASADVVTMGWVLRNVGDRPAAYREILRILKPGGVLVCVETSHPDPALVRRCATFYMHWVMLNLVSLLGGDRARYEYLLATTAGFPGKAALAREFEKAGFTRVRYYARMFGAIAIHIGEKPHPVPSPP